MTAAGVQNFETTAYLPPTPAASAPDAKGAGVAATQSSDTADGKSDFQSELEQQTSAPPESKSAGLPKTDSKADKSEKKRNARPDELNLSVAAPALAVAEPQKPILPLVLNFAKPDEQAAPDSKQSDDQPPVHETESGLPTRVAGNLQLLDLPRPARQPLSFQSRTKHEAQRRFVAALPEQTPSDKVAPSTNFDSSKTQIPQLAANAPAPSQTTTPEVQAKQSIHISNDTSTDTRKSPEPQISKSEPAPVDLKLPATPPEPAATAVKDTVESASSSPSALAFAARLAAVPQKSSEPDKTKSAQTSAIAGSQTTPKIPLRHAATAQILQPAAVDSKAEDGPKKEIMAFDRPIRTDASIDPQVDPRTTMAVPRIEHAREAAPAFERPASPQQEAPSVRMDRIMEPPALQAPAAPRGSGHDIRLRMPDNNGGSTQVRFVESGGQVRVSVRTADEGLAQNLRSHLNDLTQRLADGGMPAEIWKPGSSAASSQNDQHQPDREGRGPGGQGSGGHEQQQDRREKRPAWLEEMETSLRGSGN